MGFDVVRIEVIFSQLNLIMKDKIFLGIMLLFLAAEIQAQNKTGGYIKPDWSPKTIDLTLPKLQLADSAFMESLDSVLFNKKCSKDFKGRKSFQVRINKIDSLEYSLFIGRGGIPRKSFGYLEYNGFIYSFEGDRIENALSISKSKKRFLFKYYPFSIDDSPIWILRYNSKTKKIEIKETYFY